MNLPLSPDQLRLFGIFFPRYLKSFQELIQNQTRFVHYTNAEGALSILKNRSFWMRKPQWMNDYREIDYGFECLDEAYSKSEGGKHFQKSMETAFPGVTKAILDNFNQWLFHYRNNTFVACVSEHDNHEDINGRLSMWRGYGSGTGVALVVKSHPFAMVSDALGAYSTPVVYLTPLEVAAHLEAIATSIDENADFVKSVPQGQIEYMVHEAFRYGMLCTKHPGFAEEREWRIVYSPDRDQKTVKLLPKSFENIGGVRQPVHSIPLADVPGYTDLSPQAILDRVIIGPSRFPGAHLETFRHALEEAGVQDVATKVVISDIPLRTF